MALIPEDDYEKMKSQISDTASEISNKDEKLRRLIKLREEKKSERTSDNDSEISDALDLLESGAKLIISGIKKLRRI